MSIVASTSESDRTIEPIVVEPIETGNLGKPVLLETNTYGIGLLDPTKVYVYDICISFESKQGRTVLVTKRGKEDHIVNQRRERSIRAYNYALCHHANFFGDLTACWYDGQSIMYSKKDFFDGSEEVLKQFIIPGSEIDSNLSDVDVSFVVKQAERASFIVDINTVTSRTANSNLACNDRSITQFMELALNQYAVLHPERHKIFESGKSYICNPLQEGFTERDIPKVGDGKRVYVGIKKAVHHIEGPKSRGFNNPALIIDAKKAAFHEPMLVINKAVELLKDGIQELNKGVGENSLMKLKSSLKGVACITQYGRIPKTFEIYEVSRHTPANYQFETANGNKTNVVNYFWKKFPNSPLLVAREYGKQSMYPMELVSTVPFTRVRVAQQTPEQSQLTTKECAVPPAARLAHIEKGTIALQILDPQNEYIRNAGLKVFSKRMKVNARQMPGVILDYLGQKVVADFGKWRPGRKYLSSSSCQCWAVYRINENANDDQQTRCFAESFYKLMQTKGMNWSTPADIRCIGIDQIDDVLKDAAAHGCKFVLVITPDSISTIHKKLKLLERELGMVVQDMRASSVARVVTQNKSLMLENVLNKANIKMGGLNYGIDLSPFTKNDSTMKWIRNDRLILGIGISRPPAGICGESLPATVVGYSANVKLNPLEFVGDFALQDGGVVKSNHGDKAPQELIVYRSGVDEGMFSEVITKEIPTVRQLLCNKRIDCKIVYIIAQRDQPLRFFHTNINATTRPTEQNIPAGIVCDSEVAGPSFKEFYLNSHTTLQGTARTPRYIVLADDLALSMNELEGVTFALAHNHQIITITVSLPAPLYIANRYAERGRGLYDEFMSSISEDAKKNLIGQWSEVCKILSYKDSAFSTTRINA